jgi:hypothetical protein
VLCVAIQAHAVICAAIDGGRPVDGQERQNKARNKQIAANEAKRELFSDVRVSTWAVAITLVIGVLAVLLYLK